MQNARLIATKNPEALAGAHRVQDLKALDCAFDARNGIKNPSNYQAFPLTWEGCRTLKIGGAV